MTTVLLIDDHDIVREGFKRLFGAESDFAVVAEAPDAESALAAARRHTPDVAILDLSLGAASSGLQLIQALLESVPAMKIVVVSMHDDAGLVLRALELGAHGYVTKGSAAEELLPALRRVLDGQRGLSRDLGPTLVSKPAPRLTQRERDTLHGLLSNRPPKAIAIEMGISDKTLYRHRANLMEKLGARTAAELVRIVRERGLLNDLT